METAWNENSESKRVIAELKADRDDLRRQIGLGENWFVVSCYICYFISL